jgi:cellulose synthase (UDP-forming)
MVRDLDVFTHWKNGGGMDNSDVIRARAPEPGEKRVLRAMIITGLVLMCAFVYSFFTDIYIGHPLLYALLTFALVFKLVKMLHEWYHYFDLSVPEKPVLKKQFTVDMLTTYCAGEPKDMIRNTLLAMKAVRYPHTNYLCDEADDPELREFCREHGIVHVTRTLKIDAKAGNINNALKRATGELCVVMDPDHVPVPEFLDRVVPYFENPEIGYVQIVQAYGNQDESFVARGAAEQTYHFYGPMMMCMNTYGTTQAIGANCTFRRVALDSIGGHAAGLSEDMHTAMRLHARGWKSVYVPEVLTRGLVPATLPSYYKQQLKWSRGTFDLLFHVYPKLFRNFTWRQKLHYITIPQYFLSGLIILIDILIPVLALLTANVPWETDLTRFAVTFAPLLVISLLIRQYAQRWLLEEHEKGLQLTGGVLRFGTWWIYLIGFIYTIFNIRVPYIPTPKNDEPVNNWKLSLPNLICFLVTVFAIVYGLHLDWSPYSLCMAGFALVNASMLGFIVLIGQEKLMLDLSRWCGKIYVIARISSFIGTIMYSTRQRIYFFLRNGSIAFVLLTASVFLGYTITENEEDRERTSANKVIGGFFTGISVEKDLADAVRTAQKINRKFDVYSIPVELERTKLDFPDSVLNAVREHNAMPLLVFRLPGPGAIRDISDHRYDSVLKVCASRLRAFHEPVFVDFAPEAGNPFSPWYSPEKNAALYYRLAFRYLVTYFGNLGISNISWIYHPWKPSEALDFYPGSQYVDWTGITCLDNGKFSYDGRTHSFEEIYGSFRDRISVFNKPVIITGLNSLEDPRWMDTALSTIKKYGEIHGVVIHTGPLANTFLTRENTLFPEASYKLGPSAAVVLKDHFSRPPFSESPFTAHSFRLNPENPEYQSPFIKGKPGKYELIVDGKPFYIRGVAYNTAHDWRDGNMPLTRKQVENDLRQIKNMGANTIRRYDHGIYDQNILNIAEEHGLKVLYGFWFDPRVDYYRDTMKVKEYLASVENHVRKYRNQRSVLAWVVGNETWGILKHHFNKPYLTKVRNEYLKMIELMAERIHRIDPSRPVFTAIEHEEYQLPGELAAFHDRARAFDAIGINSYYEQQISKLSRLTWQFDSLRPYLVSEFGPRGYWNPFYSSYKNKQVAEDSEEEKASLYTREWQKYVQDYKGSNIGGVAYCWHDRMEGSNTWFGLTDYRGRLKPSYHALRQAWKGIPAEPLPGNLKISGTMPVYKAGEEYSFGVTFDGGSGKLSFEWYLQEKASFRMVREIKKGSAEVRLKMPDNPAFCRLYVYACDDKGNVVTASEPIEVVKP